MRIAFVLDNVVVKIEEIESEEALQLEAKKYQAAIDCGDNNIQVGDVLEGNQIVMANPEPSHKITRLAFMNRFLQTELRTIFTLAKQNVDLEIYLDKLQAATFIDISRPDTIASVQYLASVGLIAQNRVAEILNTNNIQDIEVYKK